MGIVIALLFGYSFIQGIKFLIGASVSDVKSHLTHNWDSDERYGEVKRDLKTIAKGAVAFVVAGWLFVNFY